MTDNHQRFSAGRSMAFLQKNLRRGESGILASYTLLGAVVLLGGLGYIIDRWNNTSPWFSFAGLLIGISVGFLNLAKIIWRR